MTPMPTAVVPLKRRLLCVVLGPELGAADVPQPHERPVRPGVDDDVVELRGVVSRPTARTLIW